MTLTDAELDDVLAALAGDDDLDPAAVRRQVLEAVEAGSTGLSPAPTEVFPLVTPRTRRRRWLPALVAATVLALVAVLATTLVLTHGHTGATPPAVVPADITCLVDPASPSAAADQRALDLIRARLAALGGSGTAAGTPGRVAVSGTTLDPAALDALCRAPQPALRPLVTSPIPFRAPTPSPDRLPELPSTSTAYDALSATGRSTVRWAVVETGCGSTTSETPVDQPVVVCDSTTDPTELYLLGPAVVTAPDISAAYTQESPAGDGTWIVQVEFATAGSGRLGSYTTAHHTGGDDTAAPCGPTTTSCADYLAVVADNAVTVAPAIQSEISGSLQLQGAFDQKTATALAAALGAGDLQLSAA